ncbi:MAG: OmpA family protein [Nitrosomonas sp.]|uniref:OmpA family protein n=1 Tax=Nitrosomonas sp. TaxID=42353 RepID=UPI002732F6FE|nr:OmpA family protein [Nitrosomonas sp.]MDP3280299.1 OmpA family protein [Nitrosomonas sp.]MDP3663635.1 OmpA family protein [Nitrosomonas sp.]MDZ4105529.1 OmpA family protein [Nitrosomonas sp.]
MKKISAKNTLIGMVLIPAMFSGAVLAHAAGIDHYDQDRSVKKPEAYGVDDRGVVARNTTGLCWHTGYWTPAMAIPECDPDLAKKTEVAAAPAVPAAAAATTAPEKITFSADALFDFDRATLKPNGIQALNEFVSAIQGIKYDLIIAVGYADRIGSDDYNKKLSVRRAESVKAHLVSKGIEPSHVFVDGKGEANPVTGNSCAGEKKTKALIDCLAPDRRVEIEVAGTK